MGDEAETEATKASQAEADSNTKTSAATPKSAAKETVEEAVGPPCMVCGTPVAADGTCTRCEEAKRATEDFLVRMRAGEKPEAIVRNAPTFRWQKLWPLVVCIMGFGWGVPIATSMSNGFEGFVIPSRFATWIVIALAIPAVILATTAIMDYVRPRDKGVLDNTVQAFVFTAFAGTTLLLGAQPLLIGLFLNNQPVHGNAGTQFLTFLGKTIGWAYCITMPGNQVQVSVIERLFAWIMSAGFCEELTKLLPLLYIASRARKRTSDWSSWYRGFLFAGFGSGLGFGIAEALSPTYNAWSGHGPHYFEMQALRWYNGVPLHALWGLCDAAILTIFLHRSARMSARVAGYVFFLAVLVMGTLHGLFDFASGFGPAVGIVDEHHLFYALFMPVVAFLSLRLAVWFTNKGAVSVLASEAAESELDRQSPALESALNLLDSGLVSTGRIATACLLCVGVTSIVVGSQAAQESLSTASPSQVATDGARTPSTPAERAEDFCDKADRANERGDFVTARDYWARAIEEMPGTEIANRAARGIMSIQNSANAEGNGR